MLFKNCGDFTQGVMNRCDEMPEDKWREKYDKEGVLKREDSGCYIF